MHEPYGVVHRVSSGGAIGEYRAGNGMVAITMQSEGNTEVVREWLTAGEARAHVDRVLAILDGRDTMLPSSASHLRTFGPTNGPTSPPAGSDPAPAEGS